MLLLTGGYYYCCCCCSCCCCCCSCCCCCCCCCTVDELGAIVTISGYFINDNSTCISISLHKDYFKSTPCIIIRRGHCLIFAFIQVVHLYSWPVCVRTLSGRSSSSPLLGGFCPPLRHQTTSRHVPTVMRPRHVHSSARDSVHLSDLAPGNGTVSTRT